MKSSIDQAVILAGGQGTRLRPLTLTTPKPMIPINGKPFLKYIIEMLIRNNIKEIIILTGYLHEKIEDYFQDGKKYGVNIKYSFSPIEDETGTRIRKAKHLLNDNFLLLYADNYWPLNLKELSDFYEKKDLSAVVTVYSNIDNYTKNNILVNDQGVVESYDKSRKTPGLNGVDIGFLILSKNILNLLPEENSSFEEVILPQLIEKKQLAGFVTHHKYYGLSNPQRIPVIEDFFKPKKIVFLDRDGVINKKPAKAQYVTKWEEFSFLPKAKEALQLLTKRGYTIFVVTNQPGIARRMLTNTQLNSIHENLAKELEDLNVEIKEIFVCKHGWNEGCFCRKPNPGLFFEAARKYNLNLYDCYCIGDDERDIIAGNAAGCKTFLVNDKHNLYFIVDNYL